MEKAAVEKALREVRRKAGELAEAVEALEAVIGGTSTPGQVARLLVEAFARKWRALYGGSYVPSWTRDIATMKRLLAALDEETIRERMDRYFATRSPFYASTRHALNVFAQDINGLASPAASGALLGNRDVPGGNLFGAVGCQHEPPCRDDVQHTRRSQEDLRHAARRRSGSATSQAAAQ